MSYLALAYCVHYATITKPSNLHLIDRLQFPWLTAAIEAASKNLVRFFSSLCLFIHSNGQLMKIITTYLTTYVPCLWHTSVSYASFVRTNFNTLPTYVAYIIEHFWHTSVPYVDVVSPLR